MSPTKDGGIEFALPRGNELSNEQGLLFDRGRKQVRGIIFKTTFDIPLPLLREMLQEAILLDENIPHKSYRITNKKQPVSYPERQYRPQDSSYRYKKKKGFLGELSDF